MKTRNTPNHIQDEVSGYVDCLDDEMISASDMQVQNGFRLLQEFYISPNGHARLFYATRYGKTYVLKCLKSDYLYTPFYRQALTKEFEIGLQLDHPHICRTIGMEEVNGLGPAIVLERIDGCTLKELMEQGNLTNPLARKLTDQIIEAMGYMHSKQIIHRDLKPSNIMVTHNGHDVKLIDFSLADSEAFNVLKQPAGTSGYIAPEQYLPGTKTDIRSDIYSLGKIMKHMGQATGDRQMKRIATACTRRNANLRPANVSNLKALDRHNQRQRLLLVLLSFLTILSGILSTSAWLNRHERIQNLKDSGQVQPDGNRAMDYENWPPPP